MHAQTFSSIYDIIRDDLQKEQVKPIDSEERLTLTLMYLALNYCLFNGNRPNTRTHKHTHTHTQTDTQLLSLRKISREAKGFIYTSKRYAPAHNTLLQIIMSSPQILVKMKISNLNF